MPHHVGRQGNRYFVTSVNDDNTPSDLGVTYHDTHEDAVLEAQIRESTNDWTPVRNWTSAQERDYVVQEGGGRANDDTKPPEGQKAVRKPGLGQEVNVEDGGVVRRATVIRLPSDPNYPRSNVTIHNEGSRTVDDETLKDDSGQQYGDQKAMSAFDSSKGGALIKPSAQGGVIKPKRSKESLTKRLESLRVKWLGKARRTIRISAVPGGRTVDVLTEEGHRIDNLSHSGDALSREEATAFAQQQLDKLRPHYGDVHVEDDKKALPKNIKARVVRAPGSGPSSAKFTGTVKDSQGRTICFRNGKRTPCPKKQREPQKQNDRMEGEDDDLKQPRRPSGEDSRPMMMGPVATLAAGQMVEPGAIECEWYVVNGVLRCYTLATLPSFASMNAKLRDGVQLDASGTVMHARLQRLFQTMNSAGMVEQKGVWMYDLADNEQQGARIEAQANDPKTRIGRQVAQQIQDPEHEDWPEAGGHTFITNEHTPGTAANPDGTSQPNPILDYETGEPIQQRKGYGREPEDVRNDPKSKEGERYFRRRAGEDSNVPLDARDARRGDRSREQWQALEDRTANKAFSEPSQGNLLYRGMDLTAAPELAQQFIASCQNSLQTGEPLMLVGYTPCTTDESAEFFGDVKMAIHAISSVPVGDGEALLDCDSSVVVRDMRQSGVGWEIVCEQMPPMTEQSEEPPMEGEAPVEPGAKGIKTRTHKLGDVVQSRVPPGRNLGDTTGEITDVWGAMDDIPEVAIVRQDNPNPEEHPVDRYVGVIENLEDPKTQATYNEYSGGLTGRRRPKSESEPGYEPTKGIKARPRKTRHVVRPADKTEIVRDLVRNPNENPRNYVLERQRLDGQGLVVGSDNRSSYYRAENAMLAGGDNTVDLSGSHEPGESVPIEYFDEHAEKPKSLGHKAGYGDRVRVRPNVQAVDRALARGGRNHEGRPYTGAELTQAHERVGTLTESGSGRILVVGEHGDFGSYEPEDHDVISEPTKHLIKSVDDLDDDPQPVIPYDQDQTESGASRMLYVQPDETDDKVVAIREQRPHRYTVRDVRKFPEGGARRIGQEPYYEMEAAHETFPSRTDAETYVSQVADMSFARLPTEIIRSDTSSKRLMTLRKKWLGKADCRGPSCNDMLRRLEHGVIEVPDEVVIEEDGAVIDLDDDVIIDDKAAPKENARVRVRPNARTIDAVASTGEGMQHDTENRPMTGSEIADVNTHTGTYAGPGPRANRVRRDGEVLPSSYSTEHYDVTEIKAVGGPPEPGKRAASATRYSEGRSGMNKDEIDPESRRNYQGVYQNDNGLHFIRYDDGTRRRVYPGDEFWDDEVVSLE